MLGHALVGWDGSAGAAHALAMARKLVRPDGRITVLQVLEAPRHHGAGNPYTTAPVPRLPTPEQVEVERQRLRAALPADDPRVEVRVQVGHPVDTLVDTAAALTPDAVVLGARGRSDVARFLVGSVSDRVLHLCAVPVIVVR